MDMKVTPHNPAKQQQTHTIISDLNVHQIVIVQVDKHALLSQWLMAQALHHGTHHTQLMHLEVTARLLITQIQL